MSSATAEESPISPTRYIRDITQHWISETQTDNKYKQDKERGSLSCCLWRHAIVSDPAETIVIQPREIRVLDRIGGGDGFTGGLLYGLLKGWDTERCAQFGWAAGA
ncbi:MAG: hypothetical protein IKI65_00670, partial [Firmicutes bacterium]|nr:hypothetical protein [Bacillota bacterium]